jgi:hypothetical protein
MGFQKEVKRGPRNTILDVVYVLTPDFAFVQEVKKANARAKCITQAAASPHDRLF